MNDIHMNRKANYPSDMTYGQYNSFIQNFISSGSNGHSSHMPNAFPNLREMTVSELQELKNSEEKRDEFLKELPELVQLAKVNERYIKENREIARENLALQPALEEAKRTITEKLDELDELKKEFDKGNHLYDVLSDSYSLSFLLERLQVAAIEAEEESDKIAEEFLDGKLTTDEFLTRFMEKRVLFHQRQAKREKLSYHLATMKRPSY